MKTQRYRPRVQNGQIARRRVRSAGANGSKSSSNKSRAAGEPRTRSSGRRQASQAQGSNVLWTLIFVGAVVATGFVIGLHSQINAHQLGQAEAQLKSELDDISNRQRFEILDQRRALNPRESDRAAKQAGLVQPKLNQQGGAGGVKAQPAAAAKQLQAQAAKPKKENGQQRLIAHAQQHR